MSGEVQNSENSATTAAVSDAPNNSLKFSVERLLRKSPCRKKRKLHRLDNGCYLNQVVTETISEEEPGMEL